MELLIIVVVIVITALVIKRSRKRDMGESVSYNRYDYINWNNQYQKRIRSNDVSLLVDCVDKEIARLKSMGWSESRKNTAYIECSEDGYESLTQEELMANIDILKKEEVFIILKKIRVTLEIVKQGVEGISDIVTDVKNRNGNMWFSRGEFYYAVYDARSDDEEDWADKETEKLFLAFAYELLYGNAKKTDIRFPDKNGELPY